MRLATVAWNGSSSAALVVGDRVAPVRTLQGRDDALDVTSLIREPLNPDEIEILAAKLKLLGEQRLLPPILLPPKNLFCVGKNYVEHVEEGTRAERIRAEVRRRRHGSPSHTRRLLAAERTSCAMNRSPVSSITKGSSPS